MKQNIIILSANPYSIKDERTGNLNEGISVVYLPTDNFYPVNNDNGSKGTRPAKGTVSRTLLSDFVAVPGIYDAELEVNIGSDGRPGLRLKSLNFVSVIELAETKKGDK